VLNNPAPFTEELKFQITFDCIEPGVKEELEWKLVYVGSADNSSNDQELDSILVGPVRVGKNRFTFTAPPPDPSKIPTSDLLDVTVILLTCLYRDQEFIRIGYYVHNEYQEDTSDAIKPEKIMRNILADKPRVTRFNIKWDDEDKENEIQQMNGTAANKMEQNNGDNEVVDDADDVDDIEDEEDDEEEEDDDDDEEEEDIEEDIEEDLGETEETDNMQQLKNHSNHGQTGTDTNDDDEDIDMQ